MPDGADINAVSFLVVSNESTSCIVKEEKTLRKSVNTYLLDAPHKESFSNDLSIINGRGRAETESPVSPYTVKYSYIYVVRSSITSDVTRIVC